MSFKDFLNSLPSILAALAALCFVLTALREWAYHLAIGADFIILTSPADLASIALRWVPWIGLLIAGSTLLEMFTSRTEGFQSEKELAEASPNPDRTYFLRALPHWLLLLSMIVGGFIFAVSNPSFTAIRWFPFLSGCWIVFIVWFFRHPQMQEWLPRTGRLAIMFIPFWMIFSFLHGYDEALRHLALSRGEYRIIHSNGRTEDNVHLLRATFKGILILRLPDKDVSFLSYDSFKQIDWTGASAEQKELTPPGDSSTGSFTP